MRINHEIAISMLGLCTIALISPQSITHLHCSARVL